MLIIEKKIKIAFFGDDFSRQGKGTALVIQKIVEGLVTDHSDEVEVTLLRPEGKCESPICAHVKHIIIKRRFSTLLSYLWFFISHRERYDAVVFNRVVYPGFFFLSAKKFILYAHDASISEVYVVPRTSVNRFFDYFLKYIGKYFLTAVIGVSNDARKWLMRYYALSPEKTYAIYNGVDDGYMVFDDLKRSAAISKLKEKYKLNIPYILDISRFDPHKNVDRALDAFFMFKKRQANAYSLAIVGGRHTSVYSDLIENKIRSSEFRDSVVILEYVQQEDMPAIYSCADMLLYPSLVEGFGLPAIEAMKSGTPVITSNISSLPEVTDDAALLIDPTTVESITGGIQKLVNDPNLRQKLIKKGLERASDFTWNKTTEAFLQLIY